MISIEFSLKKNVPKYLQSEYDMEDFRQGVMDNVEAEALADWEHLAAATLGDTAEEYIDSITSEKHGADKVVLKLDGTLAEMQEKGAEPFDMKPGLLAGESYRVIPITHGNPNKGGKNAMSKQAYSKVKNLHYGQRSSQDFGRAGKNKTTGQKHTTHKLTGIMKPTKRAAKTYGSDFVTFRAVSVNSNPKAWWHPGFQALNLVEQVKQHIEEMFPKILNKVRVRK
ncbi:Uncharacterised protein [uncultured archaeon]|nr:Uncharacterised protein [uncultured archaeon]